MAECALNRWGRGEFKGFSAGSRPKGAIHPLTLELLEELGYATKDLRSKSWAEFAGPDGPRIDLVFTVCDQAAAEPCPLWPGRPITAHWGVPDPAAFEGTDGEKRRLFARIYRELENRIKLFADLEIETLNDHALRQRLNEIGAAGLAKQEPPG